MKSLVIVFTCALAATACDAHNKPVRNPDSGYDSSKPSDDTNRPDHRDGEPHTMSKGDSGKLANANGRESSADPNSTASSRTTSSSDNQPGTVDRNTQSGTEQNDQAGLVQPKSAENTKLDERDRQGSSLTPTDQGNSAAETNITAAVRKGIMGRDLSFAAQNVKVITIGTKVTLRGQVKNDRERAVIGALAMETAGVREVDNQLEVEN